jgi:toxin FitB
VSYLLDTNVISEAKKPSPDTKVLRWLASHDPTETYLSVVTLGELREGISYLGNTKKARELHLWLAQLKQLFYSRTLNIDESVADTWGQLRGEAKRKGRTLPVIDSLLAATAIVHDLTLVTRNTKDFAVLPVKLFNPWES